MTSPLKEHLSAVPAISLSELDERAALLRRVDVKRVLDLDSLADLLSRLRDDHGALEIEGHRIFA